MANANIRAKGSDSQDFTATNKGSWLVLRLNKGAFDVLEKTTVEGFEKTVEGLFGQMLKRFKSEKGALGLIINMREIDQPTSHMLGVFAKISENMDEFNAVRVVGANNECRRILKATRLDNGLVFFPTEDFAVSGKNPFGRI